MVSNKRKLSHNVPTPQIRPLDHHQVVNHAGGYVFECDDITLLRRFLVLGSEGGSYYASERDHTIESTVGLIRMVNDERGEEAVKEIEQVRTTKHQHLSPRTAGGCRCSNEDE